MMPSRAYRKATSFVTVMGHKFRLTPAFLSSLALTIGRAENLPPSDVHRVRTAEGVTPMTLSELYALRDAIALAQDQALADEGVAP